MPLTEWDPSYNLGIDEIDAHHQKLVELLNKAYDAIIYSSGQEHIQPILQEIMEYTSYHFNAEELIMKQAGFPGYRSHINKHNDFKQQIAKLQQEYLAGESRITIDIVLFLRDWLINHILKADKKCVSYLQRH